MSIKHVYSQSVADGTATSVVRPSDWNSNHNIIYDLSGNTAGSAQISGQNVTLVGGNNVTLSADTAASKLVFSGPTTSSAPFLDYFPNITVMNNTTTMAFAQSTSAVVPFLLDANLSCNFLRLMGSGVILAASTTAATTGGTQFSCGYTKSHNFVLYSRGSGASSLSLQSYFSTQFVENFSNNISCETNSTQFSFSNRYTLPSSTGSFGLTYDYSQSTNSLQVSSASQTALTAFKALDFPFATTLGPGRWWLMYGQSSNTATQAAGTTIGLRNAITFNNLGVSQATLQFGTLGAATTNTLGFQQGAGSFTTAGGGTTASLGLANVTTSSAGNMMYIQFMRTN